MDRWDSPCLASLGVSPAALATELLTLLDVPDSPELSALVEDGVKTFDAALAVDQPAILADFLGYANSRVAVLAPGRCQLQQVVVTARSVLEERLPDPRIETTFLDRALGLTTWSAPDEPPGGTLNALARAYLEAVLAGGRDDARALVRDAVRTGTSVRAIVVDVLEPAQREIGRRWQVGEISVAQEHFCTAVTQLVLTDLHPALFAGVGSRRRLVAADAPGSLHQVGLRMVVDLLEYEGWDTTYLGPASAEQLVEAVLEHRADVVAISASMPSQIETVSAMISALRADPRTSTTRVLVGGRPFLVAPDLVSVVGADGWAESAATAVAVCDQLVPASA